MGRRQACLRGLWGRFGKLSRHTVARRWRRRLSRSRGRSPARTQTCLIGWTGSAESLQPDNEAMRDRHRVRVTACLLITRRAGIPPRMMRRVANPVAGACPEPCQRMSGTLPLAWPAIRVTRRSWAKPAEPAGAHLGGRDCVGYAGGALAVRSARSTARARAARDETSTFWKMLRR
jgi:hypothetical protein